MFCFSKVVEKQRKDEPPVSDSPAPIVPEVVYLCYCWITYISHNIL